MQATQIHCVQACKNISCLTFASRFTIRILMYTFSRKQSIIFKLYNKLPVNLALPHDFYATNPRARIYLTSKAFIEPNRDAHCLRYMTVGSLSYLLSSTAFVAALFL